MRRILLGVIAFATVLSAQMTMGRLEGTILFPDGRPHANEDFNVTAAPGVKIPIHTDAQGHFALVLPYGPYRVAGVLVEVTPMSTTHVDLMPGPLAVPEHASNTTRRPQFALPFSVQGELSALDPAAVSAPLDFTGLADNRLTLLSFESYTWTATQFLMQGLDATDSYQPGRPTMLPDVQALETTTTRSAFGLTTSASYGNEVGAFLAQPAEDWHAALASSDTGGALAWTNLPMVRDGVQESDRYRSMTRDHIEVGGPLTRRADLFASSTGQWASQTMPLAAAGEAQRSRMLYGNARGRVRAGAHDRLDALYSGSRIDLSNGGIPAGMEALVARRMSPEFALPGGFVNQTGVDHLDFVQAGWTHEFASASKLGALEARYGYSTAHLDTRPASLSTPDQSRIELAGSEVAGAPPIENLAIRTRHQLEAVWQTGVFETHGWRHDFTLGGGWNTASPRNRFRAPSDLNLITAAGEPAFVVEYNTPAESRARVNSTTAYAADSITLNGGLAVNIALLADFSRGGLPAQTSPAGTYFPARNVGAAPDLIVWNSVAPRAGFSWSPARLHGLAFEGGWFRLLAPLAGRYLDYANPLSLGGAEYRWTDRNGDGWFEPGEQGALLMLFGGPYSSIAPGLRRPYADEIHAGATISPARNVVAGIRFFRRDEKDRIAAIDTGVTAGDFTPVAIADPGPSGVAGGFGAQTIPVWAQNPASFGRDRYLLTNPAGLRMQNTGLVAEAAGNVHGLGLKASFVAEKSYGPTNAGNAVVENDSGVVGALFLDPNTAIGADNRTYMDRGFIGKMQAIYRLPDRFGGVEISAVGNYVDGLVFARELLVAGLPQGPLLVATTVRGSPEGGNRAQYVMNWNLRLKREFRLPFGRTTAALDVMNLANAGASVQEIDQSGSSFNLRLPVAIQPPRFVRGEVRYEF